MLVAAAMLRFTERRRKKALPRCGRARFLAVNILPDSPTASVQQVLIVAAGALRETGKVEKFEIFVEPNILPVRGHHEYSGSRLEYVLLG